MTQEQYNALVEIKKEALANAKLILPNTYIFINVDIHNLDVADVFWKTEGHTIEKLGKEFYLKNTLFSEIKVYSKHFKK